ncbi:hypothetical protein [Asticcacaulis sp. AND118]|uniref:hypothetical protein n=1 Tax=Asticcacaulis sp. AND118 TaxID=2840468 RepID=UPI001CFFD8A2|nr:hypothetical protein [Asticcacaulis sp. AND118]UDF03809.1 hypothetical protein LH365_01840 [Asticcacaulis sp. AND118]
MKRLALLLMTCAALTAAAHAEPPDGEGSTGPVGEETTTDAPKPEPRPRPKPKPKPKVVAPAPKLPDAPIPYTQLQATPAPHPTIARVEAHPVTPIAVPTPAHVPPPPPAIIAQTAPIAPVDTSAPLSLLPSVTHDMKCETQVVGPKGLISKGQFYLEVGLSAVFPDDTARFKMVMADPRHESLLKDTACETIECRVTISPNYYDLYNARTKRGAQLRVTLDRYTGAYLARRTDGKLPLGGSAVIKEGPGEYEEGYCTLQKRPEKLF